MVEDLRRVKIKVLVEQIFESSQCNHLGSCSSVEVSIFSCEAFIL